MPSNGTTYEGQLWTTLVAKDAIGVVAKIWVRRFVCVTSECVNFLTLTN